jgi:hypothetical protein
LLEGQRQELVRWRLEVLREVREVASQVMANERGCREEAKEGPPVLEVEMACHISSQTEPT